VKEIWHKLELLALSIVMVGCATPPGSTSPTSFQVAQSSPDDIHWVIGINATDSVATLGDARAAVACAVTLATQLDSSSNQVEVDKVYQRVEVAVPLSPAPRGRNRTLASWLRFLEPIPVPADVRGTRSDLFWARVAHEAKRVGSNVRVIGVLFGDGRGELSDPKTFRLAAEALADSSNALAIYVGAGPGATNEIERDMSAVREQGRLLILGDVRDVPGNVTRIKAVRGGQR
jgi:hypothetical protein